MDPSKKIALLPTGLLLCWDSCTSESTCDSGCFPNTDSSVDMEYTGTKTKCTEYGKSKHVETFEKSKHAETFDMSEHAETFDMSKHAEAFDKSKLVENCNKPNKSDVPNGSRYIKSNMAVCSNESKIVVPNKSKLVLSPRHTTSCSPTKLANIHETNEFDYNAGLEIGINSQVDPSTLGRLGDSKVKSKLVDSQKLSIHVESPKKSTLVESSDMSKFVGSPNKSKLVDSPNKLRLPDSPNKSNLLDSPNKSKLLDSPNNPKPVSPSTPVKIHSKFLGSLSNFFTTTFSISTEDSKRNFSQLEKAENDLVESQETPPEKVDINSEEESKQINGTQSDKEEMSSGDRCDTTIVNSASASSGGSDSQIHSEDINLEACSTPVKKPISFPTFGQVKHYVPSRLQQKSDFGINFLEKVIPSKSFHKKPNLREMASSSMNLSGEKLPRSEFFNRSVDIELKSSSSRLSSVLVSPRRSVAVVAQRKLKSQQQLDRRWSQTSLVSITESDLQLHDKTDDKTEISSSVVELESKENQLKTCKEVFPNVNWHVRVWLVLDPVNLGGQDSDSLLTVESRSQSPLHSLSSYQSSFEAQDVHLRTMFQLRHSCKSSTNYKRDLTQRFKCDSDKKCSKQSTIKSILWYRYLSWQLESDLSAASTEREVERLLTKQRQLSQRICARCGQGFSLLFNRRLECSDCKLGVCRKCSFWDPAKCAWTCNPCKGEREFRNNSCDWFYFHLQKRFHDLGSAKVIQSVGFNDVKDSKTSQVRDHIEKLVESLVGDNIDNVSIARICQHPSYDRLFVHYHSRLSDCLADLVNAIHRVMQNDPLDEGETPTSAHAALKSLVDRLVQETRTNPYKQELLHHINQSMLESPGLSKQYNENQMYLAESYEDLLATVIINKVVTRWSPSSAVPSEDVGTPGSGGGGDSGFGRQRKRQTSSENQSRCSSASATKTTDSACSSDLDFYKASLLAAEQQKIEANLKTKKLSVISPSSLSDQEMASRSASGSRMSDTDDIISGGSSVGENNWQEQQQYLIEEEIEEVTEYDELDETKSEVVDRTDESSKRKVITTKTSKPTTILSTPDPAIRGDIDCVLAEISHEEKEDEKVPFPEFGVDIVFRKVDEEVSDCSSDESSSSCSASDGGSFDDEPRREKHKTSSHQDLNNIEESGLNSVITCNMRTNEWEDNWLFRRKKTSEIPPASLRDLSVLDSTEFVAMLVPNPMDGQEWKAKIGQEDIDQVSEMSERNSEASLDLASMISVSSSDDDEERFNSLEEGQQKDLEHTEYSVLPLRRDSRCFDHLYDSIGSVGQSGDLEFRLSPENASVQAENNVTFTCIVEGTKPIDVAWFHGATLLNDTGGRVALLRRRNVFNLTIFNAHQSDAGVYACMAVNPIGEKCKHFSLEVKESSGPHASPRMPSVEFEFGDPLEACEEFSQVDLNFKVKGHPEPRLIFVKNNCRLQPNENVDIVRNGPFSWTLKLLRCQPRDGGSYTVRAINSIGSTQRKWNVQIKVKERQRNKWITKQTSEKQIEKRKDIYDQLLKANQSKENTGSQSAKTSQAINMPLYPHSILKKPKAVEPAPVVPELPSSVEPIDVDADLFDRPVAQPGTIADREHRKWTEQAIRLQNNPYSRESIERRLLRGTSSDNLSPTRITRDSDNSGNRDGFKIPNGESSPSSSDDGKEQITISGADRTRRIDCGPKSSNVSRYRRDYYVQSSGGNDYDVIYPDSNKRQFKTSDASSAQGEIVERTKAMLFSRLSVEEDESAKVWRKNESSHKEPSEKQTEEEKVEPEPAQPKTDRGRSVSMERRSEEEDSSDSERLPDSLDDQGVPDSGVGSSSEKTSTMSKVEAEILRFQREIERASQEKTRQQEWERRKLSRISSSMDSLLSADELPTPSRAPALPPKGKFVSTGNLLPPALPPKQRNLGMTPKRVSISTDEVRIIGIGGYSDESDDDDFYEGEEEEYDSCPSTSSSRQIDPATYCQPPPPPDVVPQQFSRQNSVSQDEKDEAKPAQQVQAPQLVLNKKEKINDIPSKLPSVKELANKFLVKKSPEPMPRKSVKKVDSPLVKEQNPFLFKQSNSSREIHSLTARSVPRQFREGLKKSMPEKSDRNIKFPNATQVADELVQGDALHAFQSDLIVSSRRSSSDSSREDQRPRVSSSNLHIIYDSQKQDDVPYPDADFVRTPSPEHVGIPAGPLRMPPRNGNFSAKNTVWEEYTSDESNASAGPPRSRHPPQNRRKKQQQT